MAAPNPDPVASSQIHVLLFAFLTLLVILPDPTRAQSSTLPPPLISLPAHINTLHINIGPNLTPLHPPPADPHTAVLALEPNIAIAHQLREQFQKLRYPNRFFVIACALAPPPLAGAFATFHHYNQDALSSSLSEALRPRGRVPAFADRAVYNPHAHFGPGESAVDFVPVLSLDALLTSIPRRIRIRFLKIDAQGYDLHIIKSAHPAQLERVEKIMAETYLPGIARFRYKGVRNELERDWTPFMTQHGFRLENPPVDRRGEFDAVWVRHTRGWNGLTKSR